jgi:hypothetical protein
MTAKPKLDPDRTYHVHVNPGHTVVYGGLAFGDRATLQVPGSDVEAVLAQGATVVDPSKVPDVAGI